MTALYALVEREGHSTEPVTFRVRSLTAEQGGRGTSSQAAIEVHMGRGVPGQATIEVNLALFDNALFSFLQGGPPRPFTSMSAAEQDAHLSRWQGSRFAIQREPPARYLLARATESRKISTFTIPCGSSGCGSVKYGVTAWKISSVTWPQ